jgi:hypothetical protein
MSPDALFEKLDEWLTVLDSEITELYVSQYIFKEVRDIVRANPKVNIGSSFYEWMGSAYASATTVAIRRQLDQHADSISFLNFLTLLWDTPQTISRARYVGLYKNLGGPGVLSRSLGEGDFDRIVGIGQEFLNPLTITKEITDLRRKTEVLRKYVNKRVAHYDKDPPAQPPTYGHIDEAIGHLGDLLKRYLLLFRCADRPDVLPVWQYEWKAIFKHPWFPAE